MAAYFVNQGLLSLVQNGAVYKFIKKETGTNILPYTDCSKFYIFLIWFFNFFLGD